MFRFKLILLFVGCGLMFWGYQEFRVSQGTTAEPAVMELAKLEAGEIPTNNHLQLGEHLAVYDELIYEYEQKKTSTAAPGLDTKVTVAYYPVISLGHPFSQELAKLVEQVQAGNEINEASIPTIGTFAVLVKTKRFSKVGDLLEGLNNQASVKGLVVNRIQSLGKDEAALIKQSFPSLDIDKVLILEENREPASLVKSIGIILGGLVLVLGSIAAFFMGKKS